MELPDDRHNQVLRRLLEISEQLTNKNQQGREGFDGRIIALELRQDQLERDLRDGMQDMKAAQQEILCQIKQLVDGTSEASLAVRTDRTQKSLERVHNRIDKLQQILSWAALLVFGAVAAAILKLVIVEPPTQVEVLPKNETHQSK